MQLKITYVAPDSLTAFSGNARTHSENQVAQIAESIRQFGFVNPVLVDEAGGVIAGHGRLMAAAMLGMEQVPVIRIGHLSERERRALVLADNKIALNAGWDLSKLSSELDALIDMGFDVGLTGFDEQEIDALLRDDAGVLPTNWYPEMTAPEPVSRAAIKSELSGDNAPASDSGQMASDSGPKASDDDYSRFGLVMLHENKIALVEVLNEIRDSYQYDKLEDAVMHLVRHWRNEA